MSNQVMTAAEALAANNLMPGNQVLGLGDKLRNALMIGTVVKLKWYVDGTYGDDTNNDGLSWEGAFKTIQKAVDVAGPNDMIVIMPKLMTAGSTDPVSYEETIIIPATKPGLAIVGYSTGRAQGGLPQIKKGSGSAALITIRAPGCLIANIGINGSGSTGGGILLDDDGATKTAFGTSIIGCHFKNCRGSSATDGRTGGAIQWTSAGNAWQVLIKGNRFYKNVGDIVLLGTSGSVPQDVVIEENVFSGPAASVDVNIYAAAGSGMDGIIIQNNVFTAFPAIGGGSVVRFMDLTGCIGVVSGNRFADTGTSTGYGAAKAKAKIPTTVLEIENYSEGGLITREA
jgi:hypothetical protein